MLGIDCLKTNVFMKKNCNNHCLTNLEHIFLLLFFTLPIHAGKIFELA